MSANPNVPFVIQVVVTGIVGLAIRAGQGGDKVKEAARANVALAVIAALETANNGQLTQGLQQLESAVATVTDPTEASEIQFAILYAASKVQAFQSLLGESLLGTSVAVFDTMVLTAAQNIATQYATAK